jgi:HD-like signal output (HDOD) protein
VDLRSLEIKFARSENLPVLPQIVGSVLKVADDPNSSPKLVERVIERDPAVTAKILRVANSAYYGGANVPTIGRAISVLGINTIRSLVVSIAYQQILSGQPFAQLFCKLDFWRHSLAVATGSRILGKIENPVKAEELFCAGMMHDVGLLVLDRFAPEELDRCVRLARDENVDLLVAEREILGFDHTVVGGLLADRWSLSSTIRNAIRFHGEVDKDEQHLQTTSFISVANTLAHQCGFTHNGPGSAEFDPRAIQALAMPEEQLEVIRVVMNQEILKAQEAFQLKAAA